MQLLVVTPAVPDAGTAAGRGAQAPGSDAPSLVPGLGQGPRGH